LVAFTEDDWEGPAFCGKWCFNSNKKVLEAMANKGKGKVPWHTDRPTPFQCLNTLIVKHSNLIITVYR